MNIKDIIHGVPMLVAGIFIGYGLISILRNSKNNEFISIHEFDRNQWCQLIGSDIEPLALRIKLISFIAHDRESSNEYLEFVAFNLPRQLEKNPRVQAAVKRARKELEYRKTLVN